MLHRSFMICSNYSALHDGILIQNRHDETGVKKHIQIKYLPYHSSFVLCLIKIMCFQIFQQKVVRNQNASTKWFERILQYCKLNIIFKCPTKTVNQFRFKVLLRKKLCLGIVYSFKSNSCNATYYSKMSFLRQGSPTYGKATFDKQTRQKC